MMGMDEHADLYPPDVYAALVEAIPMICRSKQDILTFFRGAGAHGAELRAFEIMLRDDREAFKKHQVTRALLDVASKDRSNDGIRLTREIVRRVTTFRNFEACWPAEQKAAKGAVQTVRELVEAKDAVTRIVQAEERERHLRTAAAQQDARRLQERRAKRDELKRDLFGLFSSGDPRGRGLLLEGVLNRLFALDGLAVRESFTLRGIDGEGIVEQIDGVVELDGHLYLVEAKWKSENIGRGEISEHTVRVATRSGMRGMYIVHPGYSEPAVTVMREALQRNVFVLANLEEVVVLLESDDSIAEWLRAKVRFAMIERDPFRPLLRHVST
jgi:restriction system protein